LDFSCGRLSEEQTSLIVSSRKTGNPLFLKCLIEELRVFGHFESISPIFYLSLVFQ